MATEPQAHAKAERRGSLGRALGRLKAMMKRRHSHNKNLRERASASTPRELLTTTTNTRDAAQHRATTVPGASSQSKPQSPTAENTTFDEPAASLAMDDRADIAIDESDNDEPLLPISPQRGGPKDERARLLLQKYGLTYDRHVRAGGAEEPPGKIRRVEKPHYRQPLQRKMQHMLMMARKLVFFRQGSIADRWKREGLQKHMPTTTSLHIQVSQCSECAIHAIAVKQSSLTRRGVAHAVMTVVAIALETLRGKQPASQIQRSFKPSTNA
ncbi:hypothetical protein D0862_00290 [Hortaea werneckii]|uniref:Uncharacterized protein n=1 Tax=Hortaea werneckii TaxID=91943 RepID=A0A3M7HZI4_HORWE|nr:hypothetical protein D0862_00290 [Hortaea werneckii]